MKSFKNVLEWTVFLLLIVGKNGSPARSKKYQRLLLYPDNKYVNSDTTEWDWRIKQAPLHAISINSFHKKLQEVSAYSFLHKDLHLIESKEPFEKVEDTLHVDNLQVAMKPMPYYFVNMISALTPITLPCTQLQVMQT